MTKKFPQCLHFVTLSEGSLQLSVCCSVDSRSTIGPIEHSLMISQSCFEWQCGFWLCSHCHLGTLVLHCLWEEAWSSKTWPACGVLGAPNFLWWLTHSLLLVTLQWPSSERGRELAQVVHGSCVPPPQRPPPQQLLPSGASLACAAARAA